MELKDIVLKEGDMVYFTDEVWHVNSDENNKKFGEVFEEDRFVRIERPVKYETIYEAPKEILNKEEKKYLEAVIRPFRNQIERISKKHNYNDDDYEYLLFCARLHNNKYSFILPYFEKNKEYKGMELNKEYTLDELRLFKE